MRERLGARIRWLRGERGWTLSELAERAEVQLSDLSKWERGKRAPNLESLVKLADGLAVDVSDLVTLHQDQPHEEVQRILLMLKDQPPEVLQLVRRLVWAVTTEE
ncbi:MAG: helix-turn-helix transcriptional regulator [Alphaproteobacteria bacterium]|nr:helix-turn-helix transcriptional regulator [Alphaproteobacteria bacterium]